MKRLCVVVAALTLSLSSYVAQANEFKPQIDEYFTNNIQSWLNSPVVIDAVKAQNAKHAGLSESDIEKLDTQWRAEAKSGQGPLISETLSSSLSKFLKNKKDISKETITEIFVMDNKGLNVGQSDVTSDYMQGDEAKWKKTFGTGKDTAFIDEVEFDESSQKFQTQISSTLVDPSTQKPVGAITIGLNVENLM